MRLLDCSLPFFFSPRSKHKVKLLNSGKRAIFPLFSAGCDADISFQQKKRIFWATLDAVLTLAWASESGGIAPRGGPAWSCAGVGTGPRREPERLQGCCCHTVGLCSPKIFLNWLKTENRAACGSVCFAGPEPPLGPACKTPGGRGGGGC